MKKILVIRFSSIGDIVLTTPVVRCLRLQLPGVEIHYVTKASFAPVLSANPYIDKLITFRKDVSEVYDTLLAENYDVLIDLHKNLRSLRLKRKLGVRSYTFHKLNLQKFLAVSFKMTGLLPPVHIVERYLEPLKQLGVRNDQQGLDYFIEAAEEVDPATLFPPGTGTPYLALVVGGSYATKQIPPEKLREICRLSPFPVLVLGGKEDGPAGERLRQEFPQLVNACGRFSISQSASLIRQAEWVITSDTGMMHIAAAFGKKIVSVWGNTIPEFGMGPYLPRRENVILEKKDLGCRPCSKLGYKACPRGHFRCMNDLDYTFVRDLGVTAPGD